MKEDLDSTSPGGLIKIDLFSRPNYISGKYKAGQLFGLQDFENTNESDVFFLETLKVRADSADRIIAEAKLEGQDITDQSVIIKLGEKINELGVPIHRRDQIVTVIGCTFRLIPYYAVAFGIWGVTLEKSISWFVFYGVVIGILINFLFIAPVVAVQRTREKMGDIVYGAGFLLIPLAIFIGITGLVVLAIRVVFK